jgi:hypothetical protein
MLCEQQQYYTSMKKRFVIHLLTMIFVLFGCKPQNSLHINNDFIKEISQEDQNLQVESNVFFCKCQDNLIVRLTLNQLRELFRNSTSFNNFEKYLVATLNQRIKIDCKDIDNTFELDPIIKTHYEKMGIDHLLKSFCTQSGNDTYYLSPKMPQNQLNTILYYCFINNYLIGEDDYLGAYVILKS